MKRILLVCCLLTATYTPSFIQHAAAQITAPTPTSSADFTTKINQLDAYIGAGDMASANTTWTQVHDMMKNVLKVSKYSIYTASSPADKTAHETIQQNQSDLYFQIWKLKNDLVTNRAELHAKLVSFGATIY